MRTPTGFSENKEKKPIKYLNEMPMELFVDKFTEWMKQNVKIMELPVENSFNKRMKVEERGIPSDHFIRRMALTAKQLYVHGIKPLRPKMKNSYHDLSVLAVHGLVFSGLAEVFGRAGRNVRITQFGKNSMDEALGPYISDE